MKTIAFFGHKYIFNKNSIKESLLKTLNSLPFNEYNNFLIGCHGDFDSLALSTCIYYRNCINKNVSINVVLTNLSILNKNDFNNSKMEFYKQNGCTTMLYDIEQQHYKNRITYTNKKMVDNSDLIICYVDMKSYKSGAKTAINYAKKQNKQIINLFKEKARNNKI